MHCKDPGCTTSQAQCGDAGAPWGPRGPSCAGRRSVGRGCGTGTRPAPGCRRCASGRASRSPTPARPACSAARCQSRLRRRRARRRWRRCRPAPSATAAPARTWTSAPTARPGTTAAGTHPVQTDGPKHQRASVAAKVPWATATLAQKQTWAPTLRFKLSAARRAKTPGQATVPSSLVLCGIYVTG